MWRASLMRYQIGRDRVWSQSRRAKCGARTAGQLFRRPEKPGLERREIDRTLCGRARRSTVVRYQRPEAERERNEPCAAVRKRCPRSDSLAPSSTPCDIAGQLSRAAVDVADLFKQLGGVGVPHLDAGQRVPS